MTDRTDIISNDVIVERLRRPDGVRGLLRETLPLQSYLPFVHEMTHHWCFSSPIGSTVAMLQANSDFNLWRAKTKNDVKTASADRLIGRALATAYRPIAEGLAIFAQQDMRMSIDGLSIEPCEWVTNEFVELGETLRKDLENTFKNVSDMYSDNTVELISDENHSRFVDTVNSFLDEQRLTKDSLRERERLSLSRLDGADGGYLAGYLLIRRAYNNLRGCKTISVDPNSFLAFAKQYFFHDTVLAQMALDDREKRSIDVIFSRVEKRLNYLESDSVKECYRKFFELSQKTRRRFACTRWPSTLWDPLDLPSDGDDRLSKMMTHRLERAGVLRGDESLEGALFIFRISMRDFVCLTSISGNLSSANLTLPSNISSHYQSGLIKDHIPDMAESLHLGCFSLDPRYGMDAKVTIPVKSKITYDNIPASLDLLFWSPGAKRIVALYDDLVLVSHALNKDHISEDVERIIVAGIEERRALAKNNDVTTKHSKSVLKQVFENFDHDIEQHISKALENMLSNCLFPSDDEKKSCFYNLRERGFFELYDTQSRAQQHARFCAEVSCEKTIHGGNVNDLLKWAERTSSIVGWPIITRSGHQSFLSAL